MKTNEQNRQGIVFSGLLFSVLAFLIYIILTLLLSKTLIGWIMLGKADEKGLLSAVRFDGNNPANQYLLGRYYHTDLSNPDIEKAILSYRESLVLSPVQSSAWIDLSKAYQITGQSIEAEYALERAVKLSPNNPDLMWEAGTFWLINNMTDKAVSALRRYILLMPDKQSQVYDLCWKLKLDNSRILSDLIPQSYEYQSRYLMYLINTKRTWETQEVWKLLDKKNLDKKIFISYINFLINNSLYENAKSVWKEITEKIEDIGTNDDSSLIWNAGFENEILNGGLDWLISEVEGANVFIDESIHLIGNRSLGLSFDGKHNPDITIAQQVVRVDPGTKYTLRSYIKTDSLTTTNGIILNVQGHNCNGLNKKTDAMTGTTFWREVSLDFETPAGCRAVTVKIRRERSGKFDNKIEGTAWIDGISLKQQADLLKSSSRKP